MKQFDVHCPFCGRLLLEADAKTREAVVSCEGCGGEIAFSRLSSGHYVLEFDDEGPVTAMFFSGMPGAMVLSADRRRWLPVRKLSRRVG